MTAIEPLTVYRVPGDTFRDVVNEHKNYKLFFDGPKIKPC